MNTTSSMCKKVYAINWDTLGRLLEKIKDRILGDLFLPEAVVGISRGGLIPATYFAHALNARQFHALGILRNASNERYSSKQEPELVWSTPTASLQGKSVLLVDDIVSEGKTMSLATEFLRNSGAQEIRSAAIVQVPILRFKPNYCGFTADSWIIFPWETSGIAEGVPAEEGTNPY